MLDRLGLGRRMGKRVIGMGSLRRLTCMRLDSLLMSLRMTSMERRMTMTLLSRLWSRWMLSRCSNMIVASIRQYMRLGYREIPFVVF